ncbi:hypothetical protein [Companilactobacillus kimchiensis]|uniref:Uncharacterized protein n=1 Tax=Companilactobacillus kimchiensis TaxID=993692 RepID=A0A0R2LQS4_9LACO|nr:hypothetical protein [Companilactobacillus kimchiensis]KRO00730.1 hypothetical protein IV57_GL000048 [Companilactobacillus kimchiensis]
MEKSLSCFELIGAWLIFIFPLYQGMLELQEQIQSVKRNEIKESTLPKISMWYWLFPPLKIRLEKQRMFKLLSQRHTSNTELEAFLHFLDKATAWFYVALGGLLTAISVTYGTLEQFKIELSPPIFWLLIIVIIICTFVSDNHRINSKRKQRIIQKIQNGMDNNL